MRWLPALLVGAATLVGCGGDTPSYVRDGDGVLRITLDEYRIRPENIVTRPGRIHLVVDNQGRLTHNLAVQAIDRAEGEQPKEYARTDTLQPGESGSERETFSLPPGKYRLTCTIGNHDDLGQYGELKIEK